ncbi:MAG: PilZ domain-containing protein [Desulfobacterales bacterium]|nr:PilZ domain-containing protein [Desulfobacterales bacterium]
MFWKKKKPPAVDTLVELDDKRGAFRYVFPPGKRLPMVFKGKPVRVLDLSAGGIAITDEGFKTNDTDTIQLNLSMPNYIGNTLFKAKVKVLRVTDKGICHCIFENCQAEDNELLHKYVLEMQKQDLKSK